MENGDLFLLSRKFPQFSFAREADEWLASIKPSGQERKKLLAQFEERRITKFHIEPKLFPAGFRIGPDGNFLVSFNDMNTPEDDAEGLGHEIGHTFHYDLTENPPLCAFPDEIPYDLFSLVECFCREFSKRWLESNGKEFIIECCRNERVLMQV